LALAHVNAGTCELKANRYDVAEKHFVRGVAVSEAVLGPDHPDTGDARESLGNLYSMQGRHELALQTLQRAATTLEQAPIEAQLSVRTTLAAAMQRAGDVEDAEQRFRDTLVEIETSLGADHELAGFIHDALGSIDADAGRLDAARRHYERAHEIDVLRHGAQHPDALESARVLARIAARLDAP
jgi:tetratricopeptide (TPR) repeat protein